MAAAKQLVVAIDGRAIRDATSFYNVFSRAFGFPDFYGRNMNAWIDCMSSLDSEFSLVRVAAGNAVVVQIDHAIEFKSQAPSVWEAFIDCAAFVNQRRLESGEPAILFLSWA